ncbi:MAG: OmpA family protein [Porphyrobacter sp.]|nr:OmpA family protein [Porphyrobacter sp.]
MTERRPAMPVLLAAAVLAVPGCRGPDTDPPAQTGAGAAADPAATPTEQPVASIIRPEVVPDPVVVLPPEPLRLTVTFPEGSALTEDAKRRLAAMMESDAVAEGWPIVLRGHSDAAGSDAANLRVSRRRAEAVAEWLVDKGIERDRIHILAFGEQNPVAPNARPDATPDEAGRARNRRVEILVAPGGTPPAEQESVVEEIAEDVGGPASSEATDSAPAR